jgi:hypothetical protein
MLQRIQPIIGLPGAVARRIIDTKYAALLVDAPVFLIVKTAHSPPPHSKIQHIIAQYDLQHKREKPSPIGRRCPEGADAGNCPAIQRESAV